MKKWAVLGVAILAFSSNSAQATRVVLDNVPHYEWWYGCTPTAAGSLMAYWDSQPGFENLYKKGDAQVWGGNGTTGTKRIVASQNYINGDYDPPDCLASFLGTDITTNATSNTDINAGLKAFAEWDDTSEYDMKDGYQAITKPYMETSAVFDPIKAEIDAGRPVLLTMSAPGKAHSVLAYGYDDDITFQVYDVGISESITVPGFAVMDTWTPGSGSDSRWYDFDGVNVSNVEEIFDGGHEWWPYNDSVYYIDEDDWRVATYHTFELVPEPATILFFSLGCLMLRRKHKK